MKKLSLGDIYAKDVSTFFRTGRSTNYITFSVDYFGTSEYFSGRKKKKSLNLVSKTLMVRLTGRVQYKK